MSHRDTKPDPDHPIRTSLSPRTYLFISLFSFIISVCLIFCLGYYNRYFTENLGNRVYYLLLFPLAISISAFVFGVMRSSARYEGHAWHGTLKLGGPILLVGAVVYFGFILPAQDAFDFNIALSADTQLKTSGAYPPLKDARLLIRIGNEWKTASGSSNGDFDFKQIPQSYYGKELPLKLEAQYWKLSANKVLLRDKGTTLQIMPDGSLSHISGKVKDNFGSYIQGAAVQALNITTISNSLGDFQLNIPLEKQRIEYQLDCSAGGYGSTRVTAKPETNDNVPIILTKK